MNKPETRQLGLALVLAVLSIFLSVAYTVVRMERDVLRVQVQRQRIKYAAIEFYDSQTKAPINVPIDVRCVQEEDARHCAESLQGSGRLTLLWARETVVPVTATAAGYVPQTIKVRARGEVLKVYLERRADDTDNTADGTRRDNA